MKQLKPRDDERLAAIYEHLAHGWTPKEACRFAGVAPSTFKYWQLTDKGVTETVMAAIGVSKLRLAAPLTEREQAFIRDPRSDREMGQAMSRAMAVVPFYPEAVVDESLEGQAPRYAAQAKPSLAAQEQTAATSSPLAGPQDDAE